jgi:hypothetical protein
MTDIHATIAKLRELTEKATYLPWKTIPANNTSVADITTEDGIEVVGELHSPSAACNIEDAELIVAMRNSLPDLLDHIRRLERVAEAADELIVDIRVRNEDPHMEYPVEDILNPDHQLMKALEALEVKP